MHPSRQVLALALSTTLSLGAFGALAGDPLSVSQISGPWASDGHRATRSGMLLAQLGEGKAADGKTDTPREAAPWYARNNMHKYLGLGSLALAGLTVLAPKEEGGAHEMLANGAAVLGGAAIATGFYAHGDDPDWKWSDPDTRHAVYGALGTLGYLLAVAKGGEGGHAAAGALGAVAMVASIRVVW